MTWGCTAVQMDASSGSSLGLHVVRPSPSLDNACRSCFGVQSLACLKAHALSLTISLDAPMWRHTRIIPVDEINLFLLTDLEILGAEQVESTPGLYFKGFDGGLPVSPLMPCDWWWP